MKKIIFLLNSNKFLFIFFIYEKIFHKSSLMGNAETNEIQETTEKSEIKEKTETTDKKETKEEIKEETKEETKKETKEKENPPERNCLFCCQFVNI